MANLSITHSMVPGDLARADDVNDNFQDVLLWTLAGGGGVNATGIQNDNFGIMTGFIKWQMVSDDQAIKIDSTSNVGTILIEQTAALLSGEQGVYIHDTAAQVNPSASLHVHADNASNNQVAVKITHEGTGNALVVNDGTSDVASVDSSGNLDCESLDTVADANVGGNLDVTGAGPHSIANNLDVDSCDVAGLLTCDTINATSPSGTSTITNDLNVLGVLSAATLSLTDLTVTNNATVSNILYVGPATSVQVSKANNLVLQVENKVKLGATGPTVGPEKTGDTNSTGLAMTSSNGLKNEVAVMTENISGSLHLRIVRGTIRMDRFPGPVNNGEGWSSPSGGSGYNDVHFSPAFNATPVVLTTCGGDAQFSTWVTGIHSGGCRIWGVTSADRYVHFLAIGTST